MNVPGPIRGTRPVSGSTYTLDAADADWRLRFTDECVVTVPEDVFDSPRFVLIEQAGSGKVTLAGDGSMTLNTAATLATRAQYSTVAVMFNAADGATVAGDLEAPP